MNAELLTGRDLYLEVVQRRMMSARKSVWISTANVKAMLVKSEKGFVPLVDVLAPLAKRGVELRLLHAELPSRPFRQAFDRHATLIRGGLALRICPRVHFKAVLVDGAWLYLGSANLTGAGLGAKSDDRRNFEVGVTTTDPGMLDHITAMFEAIWSGAECASCRLHASCPDPIGPSGGTPSRRRNRGEVVLGRPRRLSLHP